MTRDEFERLKEAEKAHLRKLKELKQTLSGVRRMQSSRQALDDMTAGSRDLLDENDSLVEKLTFDAAMVDARMDMALDTEADRSRELDKEEMEEALRKARAQEFVERMRQQTSPEQDAMRSQSAPGTVSPDDQRTSMEKTIGKPKEIASESSTQPDSKSLPEKTIGRVKQ